MKEFLDLFGKWEVKNKGKFPSIILFSDGSGTLVDDYNSELLNFDNIDELVEFLKK